MNPDTRNTVLTYHKAVRHLGITPAEAALLVAVAHGDGPSLNDVAEILEVSAPVVSKTKKKLRSGLLVEDQADGRTLRLRLTAQGRGYVDRLAGIGAPDDEDDL
jgi:DNA-binding MarR family transcriptional regulator